MTLSLLRNAVVAVAAVPVVLLGVAGPASADGPLQITGNDCYQTTAGGYYGGSYHQPQMECYFAWSGGTGTVTPTYSGNVVFDYGDGHVQAYCNTVYITVTDSLGATASGSGSTTCGPIAP